MIDNIQQWKDSLLVKINGLHDIEIHKNNPTNLYIP